MTGGPIVDVEAGCASGAAALMLGSAAIRAGQYDTVLVFGIEKMPKGIIRSSFFEPWREQAGLAATPAYFALRAQRLMRESGLTKDDLAAVVVKNRAQGVHNPNAMFRKAVTAEEVLGSRVVCEPLHLWMLCSPNEGAAAVVLAARRRAGRVRVRSTILRSHLPGNVLDESTPLSGLVDDDVPSSSTLAADAAYEEAGVGVEDLDLVECQDTDAARELLAYEELRLCGPGDAGKLLADGATALGGRLPVNVSGGLLSKGEPLGASALGQVIELTHNCAARPVERQVPNARVGSGPHGRARRQRLGDDPVGLTSPTADGRRGGQAAAVVDHLADAFDIGRRPELQVERERRKRLHRNGEAERVARDRG